MTIPNPTTIHGRYWDAAFKWIQKLSYLFSVLGVTFDQFSTRLGLQHPLIYESNPLVRGLLEAGLWLPVDILILAAMLLVCRLVLTRWSFPYRAVVYLGPLTYGLLRLFTGFANILLLISVLGYHPYTAF